VDQVWVHGVWIDFTCSGRKTVRPMPYSVLEVCGMAGPAVFAVG
jgi:hypothetical protein